MMEMIWMGRKLGEKQPTRVFSFSLRPGDKVTVENNKTKQEEEFDTVELIRRINVIAEREKTPRSELMKLAIRDYVERHYPGNSQTLYTSYCEGGDKSAGQFEQEIIRFFEKQSKDGFMVYRRGILKKLRDELNYSGGKLLSTTDRICVELGKSGVKVWQ